MVRYDEYDECGEYEVTHEVLSDLGYIVHPKTKGWSRHRLNKLFVKGPIPLVWLVKANVASNTAVVAMVIKTMIDMTGKEPVYLSTKIWEQLDLTRDTRKRALDALERVGVIRTERLPGKSTRIWLIDKP
jgi:hypothetical protein